MQDVLLGGNRPFIKQNDSVRVQCEATDCGALLEVNSDAAVRRELLEGCCVDRSAAWTESAVADRSLWKLQQVSLLYRKGGYGCVLQVVVCVAERGRTPNARRGDDVAERKLRG